MLSEAGSSSRARAFDAWTARIGIGRLVVRAYERPERDFIVFARWSDPSAVAADKRRKLSLGLRVRDADGRRHPEMVRRAEEALQALYMRLAAGLDPTTAPDRQLTLAEGFAAALAPDGSGIYPTRTAHVRTAEAAAQRILVLLGQNSSWASVTPSRSAFLWRRLAEFHKETGHCGPRMAEVTLSTLYRTRAWLRENGRIPADACPIPSGWRASLRKDWVRITGVDREPIHPRHSRDELYLIFERLDTADPRLRLALELGAELRLGQLLTARRSDLDLNDGRKGFRAPAPTRHGALNVRGAGRKGGELVVLTAHQRRVLDQAFTGYLALYVAAERAHEIHDFPLFPAGRLRKGRAVVRPDLKRWNRRSALDAFHAFERGIGIEPESNRGWYGLRRQATDLAPEWTDDDRVLDRVGGHSRETREGIYQDRRHVQFAEAAAQVREHLRSRRPTPARVNRHDDSDGPELSREDEQHRPQPTASS